MAPLYDYEDFLKLEEPYPLWCGQYTPGSGYMLHVQNPANGETIASTHTPSEEDVASVVEIAHKMYADGVWALASRQHRADVLDKAAELLAASLDKLIAWEVMQTGRPIREMKAQVPSLVRWFRYYAALLRTEERAVLPTMGSLHNWVDRVALGVVVQITPFNHPLLIAVKKLVPALAAGNSVILKPSELTPVTSLLLGPILTEAGLPEGVFSVLPGLGSTVGNWLVSHKLVRKVDITGGTNAGRAIGSIVGGNLARYTAELGGKAPLIVFQSASVDAAVNGIAFGSFIASGQTCVASTRILVHNSIIDEVRQKLILKAQSIMERMGSPFHPASTMGPVISDKQLRHIEALVKSAVDDGAKLLHGGSRMRGTSSIDNTDFGKGYFYPPTILDLGSAAEPKAPIWKTSDSDLSIETRLWNEEAFGPVVVLVGFDNEPQAVGLANDTIYGLGAALWTTDLSQSFRISEHIRAGIVWVNTHHRNDPSSPWGGLTASSGVGSENGVEAYRAYTMTKSTIINYATTKECLDDDWFADNAKDVRYG
ncbi:betaine aldehyde dehydrogenase [Akanthomyces lecanii RCEF 1005]|uniref:aldehyde dehydrogenase (NAD(+)) n=1 Tax=Akanthomyces lecanii RCEF 1005 TaxID=1081108 RepID=A0A162N536_CORDF|nr:betaine aldehyde dehydrogenase [Akanthomyces lecanii RCEF 1005]